jgi:hypothetical protein
MVDVKKKHQQKISEQKIQKRLEKEEKKYIQLVMEEKKCDWRKELNEGMTSSGTFFTTLPATGDVNLAYPSWNILVGDGYSVSGGTVTINGSGGGLFGNGVGASFDTSIYTTLVFDVNIIGDEILGVFGSSPSPILVALTSGTYSVSLENILLFVVPLNGSVQINNLRYQRRTPMNVFVSLDSPEATSFTRTGSPNTTPEERRKQLQSQLKAGKQYTDKQFGPNFPGSNYVMPGEAGATKLTPQQNAALDKQIKDLQAQAEKNKQDANNKRWQAAAELGMDLLQAAAFITPVPGDEAIVAAAQAVKTGPTAARGFAKANPGKYNPFLSQQSNKYFGLPRK